MPLADDDALVAGAAVDHEIAEAVGIDPVVIGATAGIGGDGKTADHQAEASGRKLRSLSFERMARHPSAGRGNAFASSLDKLTLS